MKLAAEFFVAVLLWSASSFAQQPSFPVDQNKITIGAKEISPEEVKKQVAGGGKVDPRRSGRELRQGDDSWRHQYSTGRPSGALENNTQGHNADFRMQSRDFGCCIPSEG